MSAIESVMNETRVFTPAAEVVAKATISGMAAYEALCKEADTDYAGYWARLAREHVSWKQPFTQSLDESNAPFFKWFADGKLNVSYNCLDRNVEAGLGGKTAIIFEADDGAVTKVTYAELLERVGLFANALKARGIKKGDRVLIYMPMSIEGVVAMQACARIGAIHSVVFGGFSVDSLQGRIEDSHSKLVITCDGAYQNGKVVELKAIVDESLKKCPSVENVIVVKRVNNGVTMEAGRDHWYHDLCQLPIANGKCATEELDAEDPLFILYTSGSTGKPKAILHTHGGYMVGTYSTLKYVFDVNDMDRWWCTADPGWITGHSYLVYGPMIAGVTSMLFEGGPAYPYPNRWWQVIERYGITIFYTAPTAIRGLMRFGESWPNKHDLSSLRLLGTVGEPINP